MNTTTAKCFVVAASLLLLAACGSGLPYQAPTSGSQLTFVQNIEPLRATSRVAVTISIFRADEAGEFISVGQLSKGLLSSPTALVPNVKHKIVADFDIRSIGVTSRLSDHVTFTPKLNAKCQLVISYLHTGYGLRLLPCGVKTPI